MKKTISMYWPLAVIFPLAAAAYIHVSSEASSRVPRASLGAGQLTAELARAVSYGLVGNDASGPAKSMREAAALPVTTTF